MGSGPASLCLRSSGLQFKTATSCSDFCNSSLRFCGGRTPVRFSSVFSEGRKNSREACPLPVPRRRFPQRPGGLPSHDVTSDFGEIRPVRRRCFGRFRRDMTGFSLCPPHDVTSGLREFRPEITHESKSSFRLLGLLRRFRLQAAEVPHRPDGLRRLFLRDILHDLVRPVQQPLPPQCLAALLQIPAGGVEQGPAALAGQGGAVLGGEGLHRHLAQGPAGDPGPPAPPGGPVPQGVRQAAHSAAWTRSRHWSSEGRKEKGSFCWQTLPIS